MLLAVPVPFVLLPGFYLVKLPFFQEKRMHFIGEICRIFTEWAEGCGIIPILLLHLLAN